MNINWTNLLFSFEGRINRAKYWITVVVYLVALIVMGGLTYALMHVGMIALLVVVIVYLAMVVSGVAVGVKRLHDRDKSAWWLLVFYLLPALLTWIGTRMPGGFILEIISFGISVWAFVELGCLRGTSGPNAYGPDPLAA